MIERDAGTLYCTALMYGALKGIFSASTAS